MNLDQYRAVTKTELDISDHSDADRAGDSGERISLDSRATFLTEIN